MALLDLGKMSRGNAVKDPHFTRYKTHHNQKAVSHTRLDIPPGWWMFPSTIMSDVILGTIQKFLLNIIPDGRIGAL